MAELTLDIKDVKGFPPKADPPSAGIRTVTYIRYRSVSHVLIKGGVR